MQPSTRRAREFDPNLFIPDGLDDAIYIEKDPVEEDFGEDVEVGEELETPDRITIIRQVRRHRSGTLSIDVVIDVEDIAGIVKYDLRITKVDE